ncbi:MAG TPA: ATP-grasp fold amidoligase family protein [Flavobacteriaceae bacterium]|nr:ATP-grasp fold amidoligase family protein [Flavobacteriaceae bacterium]
MFKKSLFGLLKKLKFLPPEIYLKIYYEYYTGKKLDLENPEEFNEKIQWLKLYYHPDILTQLVDKFEVRKYVEEKIGKKYLNDLIAVYNKASKVDFDKLPDQFVLKGAHGFHFNLIVKNKAQLNRTKARFLLEKWMHKNQYYRGGLEWAYKNVKPKLIAEKYLEEMDKESISDYKFFCFNGKPKFVQIDMDRSSDLLRCYYDTSWQKLPVQKGAVKMFENELKKPANFEEMVFLSEKLADRFPFVRVDFYSIEGKTIFGEMTFYPSDGRTAFKPGKYNKIFGEYIALPKLPKGKKEIKAI